MFIITYRSFTTPTKLFTKLMQRYPLSPPLSLSLHPSPFRSFSLRPSPLPISPFEKEERSKKRGEKIFDINRYNVVIPKLPPAITLAEYRKRSVLPIQLRVINVIKMWIETAFYGIPKETRREAEGRGRRQGQGGRV